MKHQIKALKSMIFGLALAFPAGALADPLCVYERIAGFITETDYISKTLLEAIEDDFDNNVARVLNCGADPNVQNQYSATALQRSVYRGQSEDGGIVSQLLAQKALEPNKRDKNGNTAAHWAVYFGETQALTKIAARGGFDPNVKSNVGNAPLHWAVYLGNSEAVGILSAAGADLNIKNKNGNTPLLLAIKRGNSEIASQLLMAGADPDRQDADGNSPLLVATALQNAELVAQLIDAGADPRAQNKAGWVPLVYASYKGYQEVRDLLASAANCC